MFNLILLLGALLNYFQPKAPEKVVLWGNCLLAFGFCALVHYLGSVSGVYLSVYDLDVGLISGAQRNQSAGLLAGLFVLLYPAFGIRLKPRDYLFYLLLPFFYGAFDPVIILIFLLLHETAKKTASQSSFILIAASLALKSSYLIFNELDQYRIILEASAAALATAYFVKGLSANRSSQLGRIFEAHLSLILVFFSLEAMGLESLGTKVISATLLLALPCLAMAKKHSKLAPVLASFYTLVILYSGDVHILWIIFAALTVVIAEYIVNLKAKPSFKSLGLFSYAIPQLGLLAFFLIFLQYSLAVDPLLYWFSLALLFASIKNVRLFAIYLAEVRSTRILVISVSLLAINVSDFFFNWYGSL